MIKYRIVDEATDAVLGYQEFEDDKMAPNLMTGRRAEVVVEEEVQQPEATEEVKPPPEAA